MPTALRQIAQDLTHRQRFIRDVSRIANPRFLWLPNPNDRANGVDLTGRVVTYDGSVAARVTAQGRGYLQSFSGTQWGSTPDTADMSFGTGLADLPFSIFAVINPTTSAADRVIVSKFNTAQGEFTLTVAGTTNVLSLRLRDESAAVNVFRDSSAAITVGALSSVAVTYDGTGGATAMNGGLVYQNGVLVASAATNNASYVAIEDLTANIEIGSRSNHGATLFLGSMGMVLVRSGVLPALDIANLHLLAKRYFDF